MYVMQYSSVLKIRQQMSEVSGVTVECAAMGMLLWDSAVGVEL